MSVIKLHLQQGELDAVTRFAESLHVSCEDVAYAALNRLMMHSKDPAVRKEILEARDWRRDNLPLWSDSAPAVHVYESGHDDQPAPHEPRRS